MSYNGYITDFILILPVFDIFEDEIGGVRPNEDMKMSSAPSFGAPGGHIFDVVAPGLKKHVFTAMLAQHVAS